MKYSALSFLMFSTAYVGASHAYGQNVYQDGANTADSVVGSSNGLGWIVGTSTTPDARWDQTGNYAVLDRTTGNITPSSITPSSKNVILSGSNISYYRPENTFSIDTIQPGWAANIVILNGASFRVENISISNGASGGRTLLYLDDNSRFTNSGTTRVNKNGYLVTNNGLFSTATFENSGKTVLGNRSIISNSLTNTGNGTLILNGTAVSVAMENTGELNANGASFSGTLTNRGSATATLTGGSAAAINNSATLMLDGATVTNTLNEAGAGTLNVASNGATVGSLTGTGNGQLDGTLTVLNGQNDTYGGNLSGAGGVTIQGGAETLSGQNTYTGATTVDQNGQLTLTGLVAGALNNSGQTTLSDGAKVGGDTTNSGTLNATNATFAGVDNTAAGTASLTGGTADHITNTGGALTLDGTTVANALSTTDGSFNVKDKGATVGSLAGNSTGQLDGTLTVSNGQNGTYSGNLKGAGGVTIQGGAETLSGQNTYTGATTVDQNGHLNLTGSVAGALNNSGQTTVSSNGQVNGETTNSNQLTLQDNAKVADLKNQTGSTVSVKNNAEIASLTNSGTAQFDGGKVAGTTVNSGTLEAANATFGAVTNSNEGTATLTGGTADSVTNTGGTLNLDGATVSNALRTTDGSFNVKDKGATVGSLAGNSTGQLDGRLTVSNGQDNTYSGALSGTGGVTIQRGTETFAGNNTYSGMTVIDADGHLIVKGIVAGDVTNNGKVTVSGGSISGELINNGTEVLEDTTQTNKINNSAKLEVVNSTLGEVENTSQGDATITETRADSVNNSGALTLDNANITNTLSSNNGKLTVASNGATVGSLTGTGNGQLDGTLTVLNGQNDTYGGNLSGAGGVTIQGGAETLSGQNTYTGATTVDQNGQLTLTGLVAGALNNSGQTTLSDGAKVGGDTTNSGTLNATNATFAGVDNTAAGTASLTGGTADHITNTGGALTLDGTTVANALSTTDGSFNVKDKGATVGSLAGNSTGQLDGTLTVSNGQNGTYSGNLKGAGGVTIQGGAETLSGQNTYTGATTVDQNGHLNLTGSVAGALNNSGQTTVSSNGQVNGETTNSNQLTLQDNAKVADLKNQTGSTVSVKNNAEIASLTNSGTAQFDGGKVAGTTVNSGTLEAANATFGAVTNSNEGTATLTGGTADSVTNTGGTLNLDGATVSNALRTTDGSFNVKDKGATVGSLAGNSTGQLDGRLTVSNGQDNTYSGALSGTGGVTIQRGTETFAGNNTYSGGTEITNGATLNGGAQSFGTGEITNNGQLHVRNDEAASFANKLQGSGEFVKDGQGALDVSGNSSNYTGTARINAGIMNVSGSLAGATMDVQNGALTGAGSVGTTHVAQNGTLQTLNDGSDRAFRVGGDLTVDKGAHVGVTGTGALSGQTLSLEGRDYQQVSGGHIDVAGKALINGGTLNLSLANPSSFHIGQAYTIISAAGGVEGQFDKVDSNLTQTYVFLSPKVLRTDNALSFVMDRSNVSFAAAGTTQNEVGTGQALDHMPLSSSLVTALMGMDQKEVRHAMHSLSGEIHSSARTALIQDSVYVRQAVLDRLDSADCDGMVAGGMGTYDLKTHRKTHDCQVGHPTLWGQSYGSMGHNSSDGNAGTLHHSTAGFVMGIDGLVAENTRLGGMISYSHSMFDTQQGRNSSGRSDNITIGGYGSHHWGNVHIRGGASYTWNVMSTHRTAMVGSYSDRLTSNYRGGTTQGFGELSYKFHTNYAVIEPFANAAYVNMHTDGYREHGGDAALRGRGTNTGVTFSTFGMRASGSFNVGKMLFSPHGTLAYRHAFGALASNTRQSFMAGGSGSDMTIAGTPLSRDTAVLDTGISARLTDRINVDLSYMGQYGNQSVDSGARANVSYTF